jgi:hypothetical protein
MTHENAKVYDITALALFALILLSVIPIMMFSSPPAKIAQSAAGQPELPLLLQY